MQSRGLIWMLTGDKHGVQLAVSVYTAMQTCPNLPMTIIAGDDRSMKIAKWLQADERIACDVIRWQARLGKPKGVQYANKCRMFDLSPYESTIFVDADTIINRDPTPFFATDDVVHLTQFSDWTSNGRRISRRMTGSTRWDKVEPKRVKRQLDSAYPAINTGVVSFTKKSYGFFEDWERTTNSNIRFICDEIAAQIIFPDHNVKVFDSRWNWSPIYCKDEANVDGNLSPCIVHGHGWKFIKRRVGRQWWLPLFVNVVNENIGNIRSWFPASDSKLMRLLREPQVYDASFEELSSHGLSSERLRSLQ